MNSLLRTVGGCLILTLALGCGKGGGDAAVGSGKGGSEKPASESADKKTIAELKQFGIAYQNYNDTMNAGPSKIDDLSAYVENDPRLLNRVKSGDLILIWDVTLPNPKAGEGLVLGYAKEVPDKGGPVLLGDGKVVEMKADEFKKAKKATPTPKKD